MSKAAKPSKRELTRSHVIQAAIDCIAAEGFNAAHTNRIAEYADVSWGVLQYHFGDKDGLLEAVLAHIFEQFTLTLEAADLQGSDLDARVAELIELVWSLVGRAEYRVSLAILRNAGRDAASAVNGQAHIDRWAQRISVLWDNTFAEFGLDPARSDVARQVMFAALRGMADEINPGRRAGAAMQRQREALAAAVVFLLRA